MSDIEHPAIDNMLQFECDTSVCREFAEEAVEMLVAYGSAVNSVEGDYDVTRCVTERIDVTGHPDDEVATALRLQRISCMVMTAGSTAPHPIEGAKIHYEPRAKDDYTVLGMELGKITCSEIEEKDVYEVRDSDFNWEPYVLIVIDNQTYEADILSGATGEVLSYEDTLQAMSALQFVHRSLRFIRYEEIVGEDDEQIATTHQLLDEERIDTPYGDMFSTGDTLATNYDIHDCEPGCTASHQQAMFN